MATNEILQFGNTGVIGTDILSQANYSADAQRPTGHQPGLARAVLENKVLLQTSSIAAMIGQFMADYQATNVTDVLTIAQLETCFKNALTAGWDLPKSVAANGHIKLPGGIVLQWGQATFAGTSGNVTFNVNFATACDFFVASDGGSLGIYQGFSGALSVSQATTVTFTTTPSTFYWFALGH